MKKLKSFELNSICDALLLDVRDLNKDCFQAIEWINRDKHAVALIILCQEHNQLKQYEELAHLIDDYVLSSHLKDEELITRVSLAIHRRKKAVKLLNEQTLLRSLMKNIPDAVYFKDRESCFTKVNPAMRKVYAPWDENLIGKSDFDLFSEELARAAYHDELEIMQTGEPLIGKIEKITYKDNRIKWVNTTKLPLKDDYGSIIGTMGISRDITELKIAEDNLAKERTLLRTIIDHALAGIFVKDEDGRYFVINQQHVKYLGAKNEDTVLGKTIFDFYPSEEAIQIYSEDREIMKTGKGIRQLVDHRTRQDGSSFWLLTSKVPVYDDDGKCIGLVGISQDITSQKKTEQALKSAIETLERTKLQLIESEKLKTVGRLAAGVAHEVKNPLNVISLGAEYLESQLEDPDGEAIQIVKDMRQAVDKANSVIFELLDYSAPAKVEMEEANINELIESVVGMMRHNFIKHSISLSLELSAEIDPVRLDHSKMEQVFINLFLNAISVMPKGGKLLIRTQEERLQSVGSNVSSMLSELFRIGDKLVIVEVIDSGCGLNDRDAAKAFDPFYSTKSAGSGTGLGLSVTRSIVDMHHGMISLKNREDAPGACAKLILPSATNRTHV